MDYVLQKTTAEAGFTTSINKLNKIDLLYKNKSIDYKQLMEVLTTINNCNITAWILFDMIGINTLNTKLDIINKISKSL